MTRRHDAAGIGSERRTSMVLLLSVVVTGALILLGLGIWGVVPIAWTLYMLAIYGAASVALQVLVLMGVWRGAGPN